VLNGEVPPLRIHGQVFKMNAELDEVYSVADPGRRARGVTGGRAAAHGHAHRRAAGIATPEKFSPCSAPPG